jgi:hypothetical protein
MVWFNVAVILEKELPEREQTEEGIREFADSLLAPYATWNDSEHGEWDRTEDYRYGPLSAFSPEYTHAILSPEGIWLDDGPAPEVEMSREDFPELNKFYWLRDEQKAKDELERLHALEQPLWDAREAKWQAHVREIFEKFKGNYVIWVRCHI